MSIHKLTAGGGYTYLTRQVAVVDATDRGGSALADYYSQKGEHPGQWGGRGLAGLGGITAGDVVTEAQMRALFGEGLHPNADAMMAEAARNGGGSREALAGVRLGRPFHTIGQANPYRAEVGRRLHEWEQAHGVANGASPETVRARIRSQVARSMFVDRYSRQPLDERELTSFQVQVSRIDPQPVAGFDLTFSPVKSVSVLWALADRQVADQVVAAHHAGVAEAMEFLQEHAAYTRRGAQGVRRVDTNGLIWAGFDHRDSRAGDPDLHTHVAVSNKVQAASDGVWRALDGQVLFRAVVAASEVYNSRLERELTSRLGVRFVERDMGDGKPPVREVDGIPAGLCQEWSSRRADIQQRAAELVDQFRARHGRIPSPKEMLAVQQQANLETRQAKHEPRSEAEQRHTWLGQAARLLPPGQEIGSLVAGCCNRSPQLGFDPDPGPDLDMLAAQVVARVSQRRAVFGVLHVRAEAERQVRRLRLAGGPQAHARLVEDLVARSLADHVVQIPDMRGRPAPAELRRRDGSSVYVSPAHVGYTTRGVLAGEEEIVAAARRRDGWRPARWAVEVALLESAANGVHLNPGQRELVRQFAGSGARVQLALAPAGTGKTTALTVLRRAWESAGGRVIALAPSAVAAHVLGQEMGTQADTLAKLVHALDHPDHTPDWMRHVDRRSLLVIDEAGMASTNDLARAIGWALSRGASVRLAGDDRQLASVSAGGVLRDIQASVGASELVQVMRFADPAEAVAASGLRDGDVQALAYYADRGRIHAADPLDGPRQAFAAWREDLAAGRRSLLLAGTTETVHMLNLQAQADHLQAHPEVLAGPSALLAGDEQAWVGDVIVTRRNQRRLTTGGADFVKNRDRWIVTHVYPDGSLQATRLGVPETVILPAEYVRQHAELGYASTIHGAQGMTADTAHLVIEGGETRQHLYVGMTRGRFANHVWVTAGAGGDPHQLINPVNVEPATPVEVLERILEVDESQTSATTRLRQADDPVSQLTALAPMWTDAVAAGTASLLTPDQLAAIPRQAEQAWQGITDQPAWEALQDVLIRYAADGNDPIEAFTAARRQRAFAPPSATIDHLTRLLDQLPGAPAGLTPRSDADVQQTIAATIADINPALTHQPGWADLSGRLVAAGRQGHDPAGLIRAAQDAADLAGVRDAAAIMWWRLGGLPGGGPLPWLPSAPAALLARSDWAAYLDRLQTDITGAARQVQDTLTTLPDDQLPAWAHPLASRRDLAGQAAVWRAARDIPDTDLAILGDTEPKQRAAADWWRELSERIQTVAPTDRHITGWSTTLTRLAPILAEDPHTPMIARLLARLPVDPTRLTRQLADAAQLRPLPAEHPAAALWYRIAADYTDALPAATPPVDRRWVTQLDSLLGPTSRLEDRPAWHTLLDMMDTAGRDGVDPHQLTADAAALAHITPDTDPDEALARLTWRVQDLLDGEQQLEPEPPEPDLDHILATHTGETVPTLPHLEEPGIPSDADLTQPPPGDPSTGEPAATVTAGRIGQLNQQAADLWTAAYPGSPAQAYLRGRLGTGPESGRWLIGYAGPGPDTLSRTLTAAGATPDELVDAGLAAWTRRGQLRDVFRDRLILGIRDEQGQLVGFTGRILPGANPQAPKYLNTRTTPAFIKGQVLFGLAETRDLLDAGALPVRVEGPLDALAVTLAGQGRFAGLAPLGTALTPRQATLLASTSRQLMEATDWDAAGRLAAAHDYWTLTAAGILPIQLVPTGAAKDPADLWRLDNGATLRTQLDMSRLAGLTLASRLIGDMIDTTTDRLADNPTLVAFTLDQAARIIAALPADQQAPHIHATAQQLADIGHDTATRSLTLPADQQAFRIRATPSQLTRIWQAAAADYTDTLTLKVLTTTPPTSQDTVAMTTPHPDTPATSQQARQADLDARIRQLAHQHDQQQADRARRQQQEREQADRDTPDYLNQPDQPEIGF